MLAVVCVATFLSVPVARADDDKCKEVEGRLVETAIPAPNDPMGLSIGLSTGDLKGSASSLLTSLTPQPDGTFLVTSLDVFVLGPQDILVLSCKTIGTPIQGAPVGTVSASTTYTVTGGTGKFLGATGTIQATSTVFNAFGPNAGPGSSYSVGNYKGTICRPH